MANWNTLKTAVNNVIKTNGSQQITGQALQNVLNNIISNIGENSTFVGVATPETNPGTPDGNVFYLASQAGTYSNFAQLIIEAGEIAVFDWRGSSWTKKTISKPYAQEIGVGENLAMSQKAVSEILYPYTETLTEVYINSEPFDLSKCFFVVRNTAHAQQVTLIDGTVNLSNYWSQTKIESGIIKLTEFENSGVEAYVFVDFTKVSGEKYINIRNPRVFQKDFSPRIVAYINSKLMEAASESIEDNAKSIDELQIINKSYTDDMGVQCVLQEVYVESSLSNFARPTIIVTDSGTAQQVVINGNYDSEPIANYWSQTRIERGIIELTPYGDNGVKAYAYVDFTSYKSKLFVELKNNESVLGIENSPKIAAYISRGNSENISELQNAVGKLASNCSYRDDNNYIDIVKEMYITGIGELSTYRNPTIRVTNGSSSQQVTIHANYDAEPLANYWSQSLIDKGIIKLSQYSNSGIEGYVFVDFTNLANGSSVIIKLTKEDFKSIDYSPSIANYLNAIKISEIESRPNNKWSGKRLLAIGDSITTEWDWEKHWASKCAAILDMNVRVHAKGGIGLIQMVDGDGSGDAPEGFDPDTFGVSNLYRLNEQDVSDVDIIVLMGMYNERGISKSAFGEITDTYPTQNTYIGRLQYAISRIYEELEKAGNKDCKVVICSAHKYGKYPYTDLSAYDDGEAIRLGAEMVAKYHSLYFIDLMNFGNINKFNWDYFSNSSTPYNSNYIPSDGVNDGTNKPFTSLSDAPSASSNNGKYITISGKEGCYVSDGTSWNYDYRSAPWNGDQLHLNQDGYQRIAEFIAGHLINI